MIYPTESKHFFMARSATATGGDGSGPSATFPARSAVAKQTLIGRPCVLKYFSMGYEFERQYSRHSGVRIELCDGSTPILQVVEYFFHADQVMQNWSVMVPGNGIRISSSLNLAISQRGTKMVDLKASGVSIWYQG